MRLLCLARTSIFRCACVHSATSWLTLVTCMALGLLDHARFQGLLRAKSLHVGQPHGEVKLRPDVGGAVEVVVDDTSQFHHSTGSRTSRHPRKQQHTCSHGTVIKRWLEVQVWHSGHKGNQLARVPVATGVLRERSRLVVVVAAGEFAVPCVSLRYVCFETRGSSPRHT
eukprot:COSAG02_NODE_7828_length_2831_cov_1.731698_5_plen_169_part_00